ncbi:MAG: polyprenyl diphosphate synthase [Patescibacteria group bacterium]
MNLPKHIAIIPDGNRRWARKKKLPEFFGHREGAKTAEKILKEALNEGVVCITFWGLSLDNAKKRSLNELRFLFEIFENQFEKLLTDKIIFEKEIKIDFLGRWREIFPEKLKHLMEGVITKTKHHKKHNLTFLMAYNGFDEMTEAIKKISIGKDINSEVVKKNLWSHDLPPVDLVIRTGGEPHWSNGFMMWDAGDAQLYFTKTLWPDFAGKEFKEALKIFSESSRRFGE